VASAAGNLFYDYSNGISINFNQIKDLIQIQDFIGPTKNSAELLITTRKVTAKRHMVILAEGCTACKICLLIGIGIRDGMVLIHTQAGMTIGAIPETMLPRNRLLTDPFNI
jgi:hypothetical protein